MTGPDWPSERQGVTIGIFALIVLLLVMAMIEPRLWALDPYKTVLQAVVITGLLNMILAFHFAANKSDEQRTVNTAKAFEAITATANATGSADAAGNAAQDTADAAQEQADAIKGDAP
ncbi:MAG: hypothetical protein ACOYBT_09870 [Polynucleobacter sp.]